MSKAIILGATGLTGHALVVQLLNDDFFKEIVLFSRKKIPLEHAKLIQYEIDFNHLENYGALINADVVFCCLGTTIKVAGSQEAFRKVDFTYPTAFANIAKQQGIHTFCLQSSLGADVLSSNFYLKTKGETEYAIEQLHFNSFVVFRPSMLLGNRLEFRLGETIGKVVMQSISFLFVGKLKRYKAIHVNKVAEAMIKTVKVNKPGFVIIENEEMV